jgi:hypothetical protein
MPSHSVAGSGKSTISTTVAQYFLTSCRHGAFIHFDRNDQINSDPATVIQTLAYQLARFHPLIGESISKQIKASPGIATAPMGTQLENLLLRWNPKALLSSYSML